MDVREQLRDAAPGGPATDDRGRTLYRRGRRRVVRRRALGAGGASALAVVAAVAFWPGGDPTAPTPFIADGGTPSTEDDTSDPDGASDPGEVTNDGPVDADAIDEPDGDTDGDIAGDTATTPIDAPASTDDREAPPGGPSDLELVDIRVGTHEGFDRVTLEFTGDGEVGWFAGLRPEALEDASGRPRDVAGDHVLEVFANMLAFPPDLDDPVDWNQVTIDAPADARVVTEVVGSIWFEGQQQVFIGLREPVPYRMVRLDAPQRIVIDLQHP